jgi:hypothetical protein
MDYTKKPVLQDFVAVVSQQLAQVAKNFLSRYLGGSLAYGLTVISISIFYSSFYRFLIMQWSGMFKNFVSTRCKSFELNKVSFIERKNCNAVCTK